MNVLIVTWQAGGGSQPAIGLGRMLVEHGHRVRIFAPALYAGRVTAAGCVLRPLPPEAEFDPGLGRAMEEQGAFLMETFYGRGLIAAVDAELAAEPADVVVVDFLLRSLVCFAEQLPVPAAHLIHTTYRFHGLPGDHRWRNRYEDVDSVRAELGLGALPAGPDSVSIALVRRAAAGLVVMPREFDPWPDPPANVVHVGPITEEAAAPDWDAPWPSDDRRPLVVVTMGTTYMHHEAVLARIGEALAGLEVRVLVLTGSELGPDEIVFAPDVEVRRFVSHSAVLPDAALVVTHAGMGTLMAAFAAGVPALCLPLGRDQPDNAARVEELGAGAALSPDARAAEIRRAVETALASPALRDGARRMAETVRAYGGGAEAVTVLERAGKQGRL
jgi:MGT family glycosyltransferase